MRRSAPLVRVSRLPMVVLGVVLTAVAALLAAPAAHASSSLEVTDLQSTVGYNSFTLWWQAPAGDLSGYRGVTIWRQEGNNPSSTPVLVATLDQTATTYVDSGLTKPPSGVWAYTVYTRDATEGPVNPQYQSGWVTSAMSGRVTDAHGNGVANVLVRVGTPAWSTGGQAYTGADGRWLVDGYTWSTGIACFDPRDATGGSSTTGYASQCYRNVPALPNHGPAGQAVPTNVGALTSGIDAVLQPGGSVSGVVRDARGRPLANAGVTVDRQDDEVTRMAVTGADGTYRFDGLAAGSYSACAYQPYGNVSIAPASATGYLGTCSDGSYDGQPVRTWVPVTAGTRRTANIALVAAGAISGQLFAPGGTAVRGVQPTVTGPTSSGERISVTDAGGRYSITGLRPGTYTVCFRGSISTGSGDSFSPGLAPKCWNGADPSSPTPIAISPGQSVRNLNVYEPALATVAGTVTDAAGAPIKGVYVAVDGSDIIQTAADGTYRVGATVGQHTICFDASVVRGGSPSGYVDQCWKQQPLHGGDPTPVTVGATGRVTGVDAALVVAPGVRVVVTDAHGTPLGRVRVDLSDDGGAGPSGITAANGIVVLPRLAHTGHYTAALDWVELPNATPPAPFGYVPVQADVQVGSGLATKRIAAPAYGRLSGMVYAPDGSPLNAAFVSVEGSAEVPSYSTGADGSYQIDQIPPGTYTVCFTGNYRDATGTYRAVGGCYDHATSDAATPVTVPDGTAVSGIDGHLAFT